MTRRFPATSKTEPRYADAFHHAPTGCALVDGAEPRAVGFLEVNAEFARLFGYDRDAMAGMSMWDLTHPDDLARSDDAVRRLQTGAERHMKLEKRFLRRDGSSFWGISMTALLRNADGKPELAIVHVKDISSRKHAQLALERRRDQLEQSQRHANIGSFEFRFDEGTTLLSDQMYRIMGREPGTRPPTREEYLEAVHPDDRGALRAAMEQWDRGHLMEYRLWRPDGRMVVLESTAAPVLDDAGLPAGVAGTVRDITRQRAVERALEDAERIRSAFEVSPLAHVLVSVDKEPPVIVTANAAVVALTGRTASALAGSALDDLVFQRRVPDELRTALRGESAGFSGPLEVVHVDRGPVTVDADAHVVGGDGTGHAFGLLALRERVIADREARAAAAEAPALSRRELEILELVAAGSAGGDIARALHVSPETVKTHLRRIYLKLGVGDRAAAVAVALRGGLIR